jgi:hypothetical protein
MPMFAAWQARNCPQSGLWRPIRRQFVAWQEGNGGICRSRVPWQARSGERRANDRAIDPQAG